MPFATRQRLLLGIAVLMMLVPTFLLGAGKLGRAPLFEGDVRKEMSCVSCNGTGKLVGKEESCSTCRGRGVADFILPGPNRPLQLVGTVKSSKGEPVSGAQIAAREKDVEGEPVLLETNKDGQFGLKVPPGEYLLSITSGSGPATEATLSVLPNKTPIPAVGYDTLHQLERDFVLSP